MPETRQSIDTPMDKDFKCPECGRWEHGSVGGGLFCSRECEDSFKAKALPPQTIVMSPEDLRAMQSLVSTGLVNAESALGRDLFAGIPIKTSPDIPEGTIYMTNLPRHGKTQLASALDNMAKLSRMAAEKTLFSPDFLEKVLDAVRTAQVDPAKLENVVRTLERMHEQARREQGRGTHGEMQFWKTKADQLGAENMRLSQTLSQEREALQSALKDAEVVMKRLEVAEAEVAPRRLQAKVREQWPTIESELRYFLEWLIEERGYAHEKALKIDVSEVVAAYVMETKKDGEHD